MAVLAGLDWPDWTNWTDMADMAEVPDMANRRGILPPMVYIDGKSEIMNHPLTDWPTH